MTLVIPASHIESLREHLLQEDEQERFAFVFCSESGDDLLATEIVPVPDEDLETQGRGACRPDLELERELIQEARRRDMHPLAGHSHPFSRGAGFSSLDLDIMESYRSWLTGLYPDIILSFAVFGTEAVETTVYNAEKSCFERLPVEVVGDWTLEQPLDTPGSPTEEEMNLDEERYDRNIRAITAAGQQELASTHIALVGVGGIGSIMAEEFARYGVNEFTLIDPDVVEESNLPRLFGAFQHHVGRPKVDAVKEQLWRVNPDAEVHTFESFVEDSSEALKGCDIIVGGVDRVSTRSFLNEFAVRHLIPYVDAGVVIETEEEAIESMEGFIQLVAPGVNACFDCLDRGDPEAARIEQLSDEEREEELGRGYIDQSDLAPEPAVVPLNGLVASKTVSVVAKMVTGYSEPEDFIRFEGLDNELVELTTSRDESCVTCGRHGFLGRGDREVDVDEFDVEGAELDLTLEIGEVETDGGTPVEERSDVTVTSPLRGFTRHLKIRWPWSR